MMLGRIELPYDGGKVLRSSDWDVELTHDTATTERVALSKFVLISANKVIGGRYSLGNYLGEW